jgi:hypothetical protein
MTVARENGSNLNDFPAPQPSESNGSDVTPVRKKGFLFGPLVQPRYAGPSAPEYEKNQVARGPLMRRSLVLQF